MKYQELIGAIVTPFKRDMSVDYDEFRNILSLYYQTHHQGVVICGSTGEGESLTIDEKEKLLKIALEYDLDIIMGLKAGSTQAVIDEIARYEHIKPHAYLVVVPPYYKAPQVGIYRHFEKMMKTYPLDKFVIYNIPSRTSSKVTVETLKKLSEECPNLIAIKDCSMDFDSVKKMSSFVKVYCGSDDYCLDYLKNGASGFISVASIFYSELFHELYSQFKDGFHDLIAYGYLRYVTNLLSLKSNPIGIKALLSLKGHVSTHLRLPLVPYDSSEIKRLEKLL